MMLRLGNRSVHALVAVMACLAVLVFSFAPPGSHAPSLHASSVQTAVGSHSVDHGDHSHDDWDIEISDADTVNHHHADHSHEKIDLASPSAMAGRLTGRSVYTASSKHLVDGLPFGIERPPRSVTSI